MPVEIGSIRRAPNGQFSLNVEFRTVETAIRNSTSAAPIVIYGEAIDEEIAAFARSKTVMSPFGEVQHKNPLADIRHQYRGRSNTYNKISGFLRSYGHSSLRASRGGSFVDKELIDKIVSMSFGELEKLIIGAYFNTRKIKVGSVEEIGEFLSIIKDESSGGVYTVRRQYMRTLSLESALKIWLWANAENPSYLVAAVESLDRPNVNEIEISREYISLPNFVQSVSEALSIDAKSLSSSLNVLKASLYGDQRELVSRGCLTGSIAGQFLRAAQHLEPLDGLREVVEALPSQKLAPVSFAMIGGEIGLAHEPANDIPKKQVVGAARALRGLLGDVLTVGGLENAIPQYRAKLSRIAGILDRIVDRNEVDESDVIELGVEVTAVQTRLHEAQQRISDLTVGEVLAFIVSARGFLSKFSDWTEYQSKGAVSLGADEAQNAMTAIAILREFSVLTSGLTDEARTRIASFASEETLDLDDPLKREGYSVTVENLAAEAAKPILETLASEAKQLGDETKKQIRTSIASSASTVIMKHAPQLYQFASTRGGEWLEMLINILKARHG